MIYSTLCRILRYSSIPFHTLHHTTLHHKTLHCTTLHYTSTYYTTPYHTIPYHIIPYHTKLQHTALLSTPLNMLDISSGLRTCVGVSRLRIPRGRSSSSTAAHTLQRKSVSLIDSERELKRLGAACFFWVQKHGRAL